MWWWCDDGGNDDEAPERPENGQRTEWNYDDDEQTRENEA